MLATWCNDNSNDDEEEDQYTLLTAEMSASSIDYNYGLDESLRSSTRPGGMMNGTSSSCSRAGRTTSSVRNIIVTAVPEDIELFVTEELAEDNSIVGNSGNQEKLNVQSQKEDEEEGQRQGASSDNDSNSNGESFDTKVVNVGLKHGIRREMSDRSLLLSFEDREKLLAGARGRKPKVNVFH